VRPDLISKRKNQQTNQSKPGAGGSAWNPSYSGGSDQGDRGLKPAGANSPRDPILKKKITKIGLVKWLKV
jgi:hypothetical protein